MSKGTKYYACVLGGQLMWPALAIEYPTGLYSFNEPNEESPVLVTVNYYLTVSRVMESIERQGITCHLLVVDGRGINVWCGSRGGHVNTTSVLDAVDEYNLSDVVTHRTLILPQLIASSVSKPELKDNGWDAVFGPIAIDDVGEFIKNGFRKSSEQSLVTFSLGNRLEENLRHLVFETAMFLLMTPIFWLLTLVGGPLVGWFGFWSSNLLFLLLGVYVLGTFMAILDPWMPTTSGLVRGLITGLLSLLVWKGVAVVLLIMPIVWLDTIGLTILGLSIFTGFNWGGATPFMSETQMERDIIVGLMLIIAVFALGYYYPSGIF
jgi:hypothetical protein